MNVLEARDLTRYYRTERGVRDLNLTVPEGAIMGLLGENGCGKTTTIKLAVGALVADRGTLRVFGEDPAEMLPGTRARIGYVADRMDLPGSMNIAQAMELQEAYFPAWDRAYANELLKRFELKPTMFYKALSLGLKRRAVLALVIAQQPDLLILDEPAGGLDTAVRRQFLDLLVEIAGERTITFIISSHILGDVERVIDRVAFMKNGAVAAEGELEELKARVKRLVLADGRAQRLAQERFKVREWREEAGAVLAIVENFDAARMDGIEGSVEHLNLEELFLLYNGKPAPADSEPGALSAAGASLR